MSLPDRSEDERCAPASLVDTPHGGGQRTPRSRRPLPEVGSRWIGRQNHNRGRVVTVDGYEGEGDSLRLVLIHATYPATRRLVREFHVWFDPFDGRCPQSDEAALADRRLPCPGCGHLVEVRLVSDVWTFAPHDVSNGFGWTTPEEER